MLMRFDPFRQFDRLTSELWNANRSVMAMDAYRDGDSFVVHFDLPGIDPGSIDLTVERNVLTVKAERRWAPAEGQEVLTAERPQGSFSRQLFLAETLDADHIEASYDAGVLTLRIPVAEKAKPRRVEISSGGRAALETGATEAA
ncbi:MAG TPA: Hsp20/alpha crystallin family protein [Acidimicrobiales bacterium]|nr:Hsp20/alpha crystallin family protein [Acidimicrobiales bacterium]